MLETLKSKSINVEQQMRFWRENPAQAAKDIFDVDLDHHQRVILKNRWTHDVCTDILSRGTGKTFMDGLFAATRAILLPSHRVGLIAPSYRQSKLIFEEVNKLWEKSPIFQESTVKHPVVAPEKCSVKFNAARGMTGSVIEALPMGTDGGKIRGARYYDVICDEAAQIDKQILDTVVRGFLATSNDPMGRVKMIAEQKAMIARGEMTEADMQRPAANKLIISTTAYYQYNWVWESVSKLIERMQRDVGIAQRKGKDEMGRKVDAYNFRGASLNGGQIPFRIMSNSKECLHTFTCADPSEGFMNMDSIEQSRLDMPETEFLMEYYAFFPPDSDGFFKRKMLDHARAHNEFNCILDPRPGMQYTMGVDPARSGDNFAVSIWEVDVTLGVINLVRIIAWNSKPFPWVARELRKLIKHYRMEFFKMDAGGGGTAIRDILSEKSSCAPGEELILEQEFEEHRMLVGKRLLGPLVQFSNYNWVDDTNHNFKASLQHGTVRIASPCRVWTPALEDADIEIDKLVMEMCSIVTTYTGTRLRWDTPTKRQRKDRYSAALIGYDAAMKVLDTHRRPNVLVGGFWL